MPALLTPSAKDASLRVKRLDDLKWIREIPDNERDRHLAIDYVESFSNGRTALAVSPTHAEGDRITEEIRGLLREKKKLGQDERTFAVLIPANLTEAERGDAIYYLAGDVFQFHQNAKGFTRGQRIVVDDPIALPFDQAARFQAFRSRSLKLAAGDVVRITHNGSTADGKHRLNNGSLYRINRFDKQANILLDNGWT